MNYGIFLIVNTDDGFSGYAEVQPSPWFTEDMRPEALDFLRETKKDLIGLDPTDIEGLHEFLAQKGLTTQSPRVLLDNACYDIKGKLEGKPIYQLLGESQPRKVPNIISVHIRSPEEMAAIAQEYAQKYRKNGLKHLKLKLKGDPELDAQRVRAVARVYEEPITLDANQGFKDPKAAVTLFTQLHEEFGEKIMYVEEPCAQGDFEKLKYVSDHSPIPIFADETAGRLEDVERIVELEAVKGIVIKLQKAGGLYWGTKIARVAEKAGLDVMVSGVGSGIAMAVGAHFAAGTKNVKDANLHTDFDFKLNIIKEGTGALFTEGARIPVDKPGLGVELADWVQAVVQGDVLLQRFAS